MKVLGNIIWILFGGLYMAVAYFVVSLFLMFTIVGIPFGLQTIKLAGLVLWSFGSEVVHRPTSGCLNIGMNILWLLLGGLKICLFHLMLGLLFYVTIVGVPFGKQHFKLAQVVLTPFNYNFTRREGERDL